MTKGKGAALIFLAIAALCGVFYFLWQSPFARQVSTVEFSGVVLAADPDPAKQVPIPHSDIRVTVGDRKFESKSSQTGAFHLTLPRRLPNQPEELSIEHSGFRPIKDVQFDNRALYVAKLEPLVVPKTPTRSDAVLTISNVKIRYTVKAENTANIGSLSKSFSVPNVPHVPCANGPLCSPDRKWRATATSVSYDAGEHNLFTDIRISCVAGPCPFTKIQGGSNGAEPGRKMQFSVLNWSDVATYLVEAEVTRTMVNDLVRESYPAILGSTMDFTLPAGAEGPSVEAELNGTSIVFPLGPNLLLSWATCTEETGPENSRLFRCELKPSFVFR